MSGRAVVESIHVAPGAIASVGLEGDRYAAGTGYWSPDPRSTRDLTLIEAEVVEEAARPHGLPLSDGETRRNLTTRECG